MQAELRDISSVEISCLLWKSWKGSQNPNILQAYLVYVSLRDSVARALKTPREREPPRNR